ncbi:hypothetical protein OE810_01825 [Rhodobacteraceae bacterium XHP0102]|nr:hypothetical protein [Rhodobacteraceae bacterium XHP0102]
MLDLRNIPAAIINLPTQHARRAAMGERFSQLGIAHHFVDGVTRYGKKKKNVAAAYAAAFDGFAKPPFMICDDDLMFTWDSTILPPPPEGADILYLGKSQLGCLPDRAEYNDLYHRRAYADLALAEALDENYLRLFSMISSIAIVILSERGRDRYRLEITKSYNRNMAVDVRYAYAMPELNVITPRKPVFVEDMALQPHDKNNEVRRLVTHASLPVSYEGERRVGQSMTYKVEVEARRRAGSTALDWHVLQSWPLERAHQLGFVDEDEVGEAML